MHRKIWIETSTTIALLSISLLTLAISVQPAKAAGSLVGYWKFDEGSGTTAYDGSGNGNHGSLANGPLWTSGKIDGALSFDGANDYVEAPDANSLDLTNALTLSMWFKPAVNITPGNPWYYTLLMKWHGAGDQWRTGYAIELKEGARIVFLRGHGSGEWSQLFGAEHTWDSDEWYHIAITYDTSLPSGNGKIYVNGVLDSQDNENRPMAMNTLSLFINADPYEVGWHPLVKFFPGLIDDVRVYNRALSAEEILNMNVHDVAITSIKPWKTVVGQNYSMNLNVTVVNQGYYPETFDVTPYANSGRSNETSLVGYWSFDEGTGTTAYDSSGNGNDGALMNGSAWVDGKIGKALRFDGLDDYVEIPDSPELRLNESKGLTVMLWFYRTSYPQYDNVLVSKQVYPGWVEYQLDLINTGDLEFKTWSGFDNVVIGSVSVPDANKWYHVAYVMNDTHWGFYVNGTLENSGTTSYDLYISNSNFTIGKDIGTAAFNGTIDEVKIYNRSLTAEEICAEYTRTGPGSRFTIQTQTVTLESGTSTTLTFTWNTTGFAKGNYTISAYAWPVPGETNTADNMFSDGWVFVSIPGDINADRKVDLIDVYAVGRAFGSVRNSTDGWYWHTPRKSCCRHNPNCDINDDGKIDLKDYYTVCKNYGKSW
jgi:hypothetical protein